MLAFENDPLSSRPLANSLVNTSSPFQVGTQFRERLVQVATDNSATFIQFPSHYRQNAIFRPIFPSRTSFSSTPVSSLITETPSLSKSSGSDHDERKRYPSQTRINPILNNPLLNHRKERSKSAINSARPSNFANSKSTRLFPNEFSTGLDREASATPFDNQLNVQQIESDKKILSNDENFSESTYDQGNLSMEENKQDYISRWLIEVRAATYSQEQISTRSKRTKRRILQT